MLTSASGRRIVRKEYQRCVSAMRVRVEGGESGGYDSRIVLLAAGEPQGVPRAADARYVGASRAP